MTVGYTDFVADIKIGDAAYMIPMGKYAVGIGVENLYVEDWRRDEGGNVLGTFVNNETNVGMMLSYQVNKDLSVGGVVKGLYDQLDTERTSAIGIDLGAMYNVNGVNIGLVVRNLGTTLSYGEAAGVLPTEVKVGVGYYGLGGKGLVSSDLEMPFYGRKVLSIGGEYNVYKTIYVRAGYRMKEGGNELGSLDGVNAGLGFNISAFKINYGIAPFGDFGVIHRVSLNRSF
jgi:long-subunit fatty acid transport protein